MHQVDSAAIAADHGPGWRFQLSLFANLVTRERNADMPDLVDRYFAVWSERDEGVRRTALESITTGDVSFRDPFAAIQGREDLVQHITATQIHMPGVSLIREGQPQSCQGTVLVRWRTDGKDSTTTVRGANVFTIDPDGKIASVIGFWEGRG